ncbi:hypothetical protein ONZ45_g708 [Pleurotus djamor]|nr:hypothetical protein ONZ45_g708 [Pleurotus djamor]
MVCFSVDNPVSLENVETKWLDEIIEYCPGVKLVLVGMFIFLDFVSLSFITSIALKCDLREDQAVKDKLSRYGTHPVEYEEGLAVARRIRASRYLVFQHSFEIQEGHQGVALSAFLEHSSRWKRIEFLLSGVLSTGVWDAIRSAQAPLLVDADIKPSPDPLGLVASTDTTYLRRAMAAVDKTVASYPITPPISVDAGWPTSQSKTPGTTTIDTTTLYLPFLTSFDAQIFTDLTAVPELFDSFTFPKLEKLTLTIARGSTSTPSWPQKNYLSFIARSKIALSTLILENIHISDDELIACLERSPSLLRLSISGRIIRNVTDKLLKKMTLTPHTEEGSMQMRGWCPLLECVQFMDGCLWSSDGVLADMVRSRWCPDTLEGLWNVSAEFTLSVDQTHEVDHEILNKLHSEGLVVHVEDIPGQRLAIGWI